MSDNLDVFHEGGITMDVREKLVELIEESGACFDCFPVSGYENNQIEKIASHLIDNGVTVQKWIPVTERLPDKPMRCLVYTKPGGYGCCEITYYNEGFYLHNANITHWMPMPKPPKWNSK